MAPYQYQALDDGDIRLMYLLPSELLVDIRVHLVHTRLTKEDVPKYEALSYTWGERDTPEHIYVGHTGDDTLAITRNLYQALPYLRHRDRSRVLWVDAICINQQNLKERGFEVERMADIYSLADRVVVWLGLGDSNGVQAIQLLRAMASKIDVDWITSTMKPVSQDDLDWADMTKDLSYSKQEVFAIHSLLMRPWFERLWVQQEIHANRNATLLCGLDTLSWQDFRKAIFCLYNKWRAFEGGEILYPDFEDRHTIISKMISEGGYLTLGELIHRSQQCKCSDPRDRIYAVLGMLKTFERDADVKPDYTKSVSQVYRDVVLNILDRTDKISILGHCEMQEQPKTSDSLQIPSWVPDWTIPKSAEPMYTGHASGNSNAETSYNNDILRVTGTLVARISHVEKMVFGSMPSLISAIRDFCQKYLPNIESDPYVSGGSKLDAYCRTLCDNYFLGQYLPPQALMPVFTESRAWLLSILNSTNHQDPDKKCDWNVAMFHGHYLDHIWHFCKGRSLFTTEEGYMGLAPRAAKQGDRVCVLLGSDLPFMLRPKGIKQYQVVGVCYVHGIMSGEALLGPLPSDYRSVFPFDSKRTCYTRAFHSPETDIIQHSDPRLQLKPVYEFEDPERGATWVEEEQKALTSEALEKRSVHMERFELI